MSDKVISKRTAVACTSAIIALAAVPCFAAERWHSVDEALGVSGSIEPGDIYKVSLPRSDLKVVADGVQVKPAFALASWLAFKKAGGDTVAMGDLVLLEDEIDPVMAKLAEAGIGVTALHHHLNNLKPNIMFMHVSGQGDAGELAEAFRLGLEQSGTPLGQEAAKSESGELALDTANLDEIMGREGNASGGVYHFAFPRAGEVTMDGTAIPPPMGTATAINFQPIDGVKAAITGDFVMTADEVNPVLRALREHDIEVMALHNHMLLEEPRLFFLHFFADGEPVELARGLRAALDQMDLAKS